MSDLRIIPIAQDGVISFGFDKDNNGIADDNGLETAIITRLFTERRADDSVPADRLGPDGDKRGFFGDVFLSGERRAGSLIWTLRREVINDETLRRLEDMINDALEDLVEDGIIGDVLVQANAAAGTVQVMLNFTRADTGGRFQMAFDNTLGGGNDG